MRTIKQGWKFEVRTENRRATFVLVVFTSKYRPEFQDAVRAGDVFYGLKLRDNQSVEELFDIVSQRHRVTISGKVLKDGVLSRWKVLNKRREMFSSENVEYQGSLRERMVC